MGVSVRKRKMAKSSVKKVSRKNKDKQREVRIASDPIIALHWDKSLTLQQNYRKMGLTLKLGKATGGTEKDLTPQPLYQEDASVDDFASDEEDPYKIPKGKANIIRNEQNEIVKIVYGLKEGHGAEDPRKDEPKPEVLQKLEELLLLKLAQPSRERTQSERESEWLSKLYAKYGDDYEKMKWDKKLNIYQQSAGDLKKRIVKWKKLQGIKV